MKRLFIFGCGGHGRVLADIAYKTNSYDSILFLDDEPKSETCMGFTVLDNRKPVDFREDDELIVAIGNSQTRQSRQEKYESKGIKIARLIHPSASIGLDVQLGQGSVVMAGAVINPGSVLGKAVIVNTCASVDHDSVVGDYSHVSVAAHLAGTVKLGAHVWIGAGAVVINDIDITDGAVIGAGAVVIRNITERGSYVGVPARKA